MVKLKNPTINFERRSYVPILFFFKIHKYINTAKRDDVAFKNLTFSSLLTRPAKDIHTKQISFVLFFIKSF